VLKPDERRNHNRIDLPAGQLYAEVSTGLESPLKADVTNLSRGGVLLCLPDDPEDVTGVGQCVIRFVGAENVRPCIARGLIRRRMRSGEEARVAVEFAQPLDWLGNLPEFPSFGFGTVEH